MNKKRTKITNIRNENEHHYWCCGNLKILRGYCEELMWKFWIFIVNVEDFFYSN